MIFEFFNRHDIKYERFDHPPVFTCEDAKRLVPDLPGADIKNLFLRDGKGKRHFILTVSANKKVNLKALGAQLGVSGLGFASPERLKKYLNLEPGSVTLFGVINDPDKLVEVMIDKEVWQEEALQCHPLINTSTLVITKENLEKFFSACEHSFKIIDVPESGK
jgi:Ala-tRNA(Pro) deacylase